MTDTSRYPLEYLPPQIVDHLDVVQLVRPWLVHAQLLRWDGSSAATAPVYSVGRTLLP